jgi:Tfp pilus assembly protein PilV
MTQTRAEPRPKIRRLLVAAGVLEMTAGVLGLAGLGLCTIAVTALARHRVAQMEASPRQMARRRLAEARAATAAGVDAWRGMRTGMPADQRTDGVRRAGETSPV